MHIPRWVVSLLGVGCVGFGGCSQSGWLRPRDPAEMKTVASIDGKPVASSSGEPGTGLARREQFDEPSRPSAAGARVSGRVFDEDGRAVPNAKVRLVVGGSSGGRAHFATTDRSGAFTLHGLRPGRDYTLIAEYQAEDGMMSGRVQARAPESGVRIGLAARDQEVDPKTSHRLSSRGRPGLFNEEVADDFPVAARPRVRDDAGTADRTPADDPAPADQEAIAEAPSRSSRSLADGAEARLAAGPSSTAAPVRAGWTVRHDPEETQPHRARSRKNAGDPSDGPPLPDDAGDEGENPLPPALEAEGSSAPRSARREASSPPRSRRSLPRTAAVDREPSEAPRSIPSDAFGTVDDRSSTDDQAARRSAETPRRSSRQAPVASGRPKRPSRSTGDAGSDSSSAPSGRSSKRPTWRELDSLPDDVPIDEALRRSSYEGPVDRRRDDGVVRAVGTEATERPSEDPEEVLETSQDRPRRAPEVVRAGRSLTIADRESVRPLRRRAPGSPVPARPSVAIDDETAICRLDAGRRKIVELRLPGLDGRSISLADIDADLILLDFWGSWCRECKTSIEHHRDLQDRVSPSRLQVIGIACEKGETLNARRASADAAARKLGINYPVLVTTMSGDCPVQKSLQVQFYPSMILIDREGNILDFQQGATDTTLGRIDRTIDRVLRGEAD